MFLIPAPYRILALVLLVVAGIGYGYTLGLERESDRRDALTLQQQRDADQEFQRLLDNGKRHARAAAEWRNEARIYYRKWKERLNHAKDTQLTHFAPTEAQAGVRVALLSSTWVGLYNAAWLPEFANQGDTGGAAFTLVEAGAATPREALDNVQINAALCGEDRKRQDELIDHLLETGAQ